MEATQRSGVVTQPVMTVRVDVVSGPDAGRSTTADDEHLNIGTADGNDLVLSDPTVSRYHVELRRTDDGVAVIDHGSTNGTLAGGVRIVQGLVQPPAVLHLGHTSIKVLDGGRGSVELLGAEGFGGLRGRSAAMRKLMAHLDRLAQSDAPVLVVGESGTGKELVARALHHEGPRQAGPFETVDCGALSPTLVASELFGHERGAFTGADRRHVGAFERADGGTVFLDEIGELPAALQSSLLGVLERRRFRRVGGSTDIDVDVRIVSATNRDLREDVNAGSFRLDLYYRLAVISLTVPPLRERKDDIPLLVEHFLREWGHTGDVSELISSAAMESLKGHRWPGNVRELRNVVEATLAMGSPPTFTRSTDGGSDADLIGQLLDLPYRQARTALLHEFESRYLSRLLDRTERNVSLASREARMDRSHLNDLLRRHGLR
jgi:DNA-binding NtrC family response regulator